MDGQLKACITYGIPASFQLCFGICGKEYEHQVLELNRLCRTDDFHEPLSKLVSFSLKELGKIGNFVIVSFADTAMNHVGYIYQATNFLYTGKTKKRTDRHSADNKHSRHADGNGNFRKIRSPKHRYITFVGTKSEKKKMRKNLKYEILPYPKGESKKYELGTFIKEQLVESKLTLYNRLIMILKKKGEFL